LRKMNGEPATADQAKDGEKGLKQKFLQRESAMKKVFFHATSLTGVAPNTSDLPV
jgi:hypothetical protein